MKKYLTQLANGTINVLRGDKTGALVGKYGLERYYDEILSRKGILGSTDIFAELFSGLAGDATNTKADTSNPVTDKTPAFAAALICFDALTAKPVNDNAPLAAIDSIPMADLEPLASKPEISNAPVSVCEFLAAKPEPEKPVIA